MSEALARHLIAQFEHPLRDERHRALEQVVALGEAAVDPLLSALTASQEPKLRAGAMRALARIGSPRAIPALLQYVEDHANEPGDNRAFAMQGVAGGASPSYPELGALFASLQGKLRDRDSFVRAWTCEALGKLGDPRARPLLEQAARDKDSLVAEKATLALTRLVGAQAPSVAQDRLLDPAQIGFALQANDLARRELGVAEVLRRQQQGQDMFPLVVQVLTGPNRLGKLTALDTFAKLGDPRALGAVAPLLLDDRTDADLRARALRVLGAFGPAQAGQALGGVELAKLARTMRPALAAEANLFVRAAAVAALGALPDDEALPLLMEALHDGNAWVRDEAASALTRREPRALRPWLKGLARLLRHAVEALPARVTQAGDDGAGSEQDLALFQHKLLTLIERGLSQGEPAADAEQEILGACLTALQGHKAALRAQALEILAHQAHQGARPTLTEPQLRTLAHALTSTREEVVRAALACLRAWLPRGSAAATAPLLSVLQRRSESLALEVIPLLGRAGDVEARQALRELASNPSPRVGQAAREALGQWVGL
jgi:HEAT repeat protein